MFKLVDIGKLRNCTRCGKVFVHTGTNICRECIQALNEEFQMVREYVREHPGATVMEVTEETGVPADQIQEWIRLGRLQLDTEQSGLDIKCAFCGRKIDSGRICSRCAQQWGGKETSQQPAKEEPSAKSKVHIMDRINRKDRR